MTEVTTWQNHDANVIIVSPNGLALSCTGIVNDVSLKRLNLSNTMSRIVFQNLAIKKLHFVSNFYKYQTINTRKS